MISGQSQLMDLAYLHFVRQPRLRLRIILLIATHLIQSFNHFLAAYYTSIAFLIKLNESLLTFLLNSLL